MTMDKTVLVTGATRGIGKAITLLLANQGYKVIATGTNTTLLKELHSDTITPIAMDMSSAESIQTACKEIKNNVDCIDFFINSAGVLHGGPVLEITDDIMQKTMDVNFMGLFRLVKAINPLLADDARIIQISSEIVNLAGGFASPYGCSKIAAEYLCDSLRRELLFSNKKVIMLQPGAVKTDLLIGAPSNLVSGISNSAFEKHLEISQQLTAEEQGNACSPEDVAKKVQDIMQARKPKPNYVINQSLIRRVMSKLPASALDPLIALVFKEAKSAN